VVTPKAGDIKALCAEIDTGLNSGGPILTDADSARRQPPCRSRLMDQAGCGNRVSTMPARPSISQTAA
jgi:hypothetical protein